MSHFFHCVFLLEYLHGEKTPRIAKEQVENSIKMIIGINLGESSQMVQSPETEKVLFLAFQSVKNHNATHSTFRKY